MTQAVYQKNSEGVMGDRALVELAHLAISHQTSAKSSKPEDNSDRGNTGVERMSEAVPIPMILFHTLFLLVTIAIEGSVFHRKFKLTRKTSIEYAISLNLYITVIGWLSFFYMQGVIPQSLKVQLFSYIFFDNTLRPTPQNFDITIILMGLGIFFATFFFKLKMLDLLQAFLLSSEENVEISTTQSSQKHRPRLSDRLNDALKEAAPSEATVILLSTAVSYSAISILLLIRLSQINSPLF
ncbi:MAG: hypothetical protein KME06_17450 [Kastovskya adunca ATA6-11-RM4]|nr:hypothetical protein [Kastovskya adunca ATA6-11-RM4]